MDKPRMVRLQMQKGAPPGGETIGHGGEIYVVSNIDWTVLVPPDVAAFMLEDGRSGARLVEDPEGDKALTCPHCGRRFLKED